ncbi:hypothetical protein ACIRG5_25690 [Lentzea sp. NPDC102401]|uniref:hypothetical protein n=1 Tax=Lentzea sp. NPDC102401 TaxID=3364128 RepID=UPI003827D09F
MTTADEPPRTGPGQIESLEAAVMRHVAAVEASPLVNGKARPFLEEVAFRGLELDFADALAKAAAANLLDESGQGAPLHQLLVENGVVANRGGVTQFMPDGVADYLAACHVVRENPRGPSLWRPLRKFLRPLTTWPWPDSETQLYRVALWWRYAETAMRKRLNALLSRKHCDPNVHFVAELLHRRLVSADDLRVKTVEILHEHLTQPGREIDAWRATVSTLRMLEPVQTVDALERLGRLRTGSSLRRLDAVDELAKHDPARAEQVLSVLAETLSGDPHERLEVAQTIRKRDEALGDHALRGLADASDMGDLQAEAAKLTGDTELWAVKVGSGSNISDAARLRLLAALVDANPARAIPTAEQFASTTSSESTPVQIAKAIRDVDAEVALRIADDVAWPTGHKIAGPVRLAAVHLIGELVPTRRFSDLARLSREVEDEETQLKAALSIVEQGGPITSLRDFAANSKKDRDRRIKAARGVAKVDRRIGGRLLVDIAKSYRSTDPSQLTLLSEAHAFAPSAAGAALEEIARDTRRPARFRIRTVELGIFDKTKTLELYQHIAATTTDKEAARTAARKVVGMNQDIGEQLMARLASKFTADHAFQLSLALEAGAPGKTVLRQQALRAGPVDPRLRAITALLDIDRKLGAEVINKIVKTRRGGQIRVRAACLLPDKHALQALLHIAGDQDHDDVLTEAGEKAVELNEERGKQALRDLVAKRRLSPRARDKVRKILSR